MANALGSRIVHRLRDRGAPCEANVAAALPLAAPTPLTDPLNAPARVTGAADRLFHAVQCALARGDASALARLVAPALADELLRGGAVAGDVRRRRAEVSAVLGLECLAVEADRDLGAPSASVRIAATLRDPATAGLCATWLVEERWRLRRRGGEWVVAAIERCALRRAARRAA